MYMMHINEIRNADNPTQALRKALPVVLDTGHGYKLHVCGEGVTKRGRKGFKVYNPQTKGHGVREACDIYRAMRDRAKLKILDAYRELNKDDTSAVVNVTGAML